MSTTNITNMQDQNDISLLNISIKDEPVDVEYRESFMIDLDIKEELEDEVNKYPMSNGILNVGEKSSSTQQNADIHPKVKCPKCKNIVDLDMFKQHSELLCSQASSSIDNVSSGPLTTKSGSLDTNNENVTSVNNSHVSESSKSQSKSFSETNIQDDEDSKPNIADMLFPIKTELDSESEPGESSLTTTMLEADEVTKIGRSKVPSQYKELKRLEIDMVVGNRRSKSTGRDNSEEKNQGNSKSTSEILKSSENQTTSGRNSPEQSTHSNQLAYYQKLLEVRSRSLNKSNSINDLSTINAMSELESVSTNAEDLQFTDEPLLQDNTFSCSKCSFTADKRKTLRRHEYNHEVNKLPIYNCSYCNQKYTKHYLLLHMANVHPGQKVEFPVNKDAKLLKCPKCGYLAESKLLLDKHLEKHSNLNNVCNKCSFSTTNLGRFKQHLKGHETMPTLKCPYCPFTSTTKILNRHILICSKKFKKTVARKPITHKIKQNLIKCPSCPFTTTLRIKLRAHIDKKHKKNYRFNCEHCGLFGCNNEKLFEIHILSHIARNPRLQKTCPYCPFRTTLQSLLSHVQVHHKAVVNEENNSTEFKCLKCSFSTELRTELKKHTMEHHPKHLPGELSFDVSKKEKQPTSSLYNCKECSFESNQYIEFENHKLLHPEEALQSIVGLTEEKIKYPSLAQLRCKNCSFTCEHLSQLASHQLIHGKLLKPENDLDTSTMEYLFKCKQCPFEVDQLSELLDHQLIHQSKIFNEKFNCHLCSFTSVSFGNLCSHMKTHKLRQPIKKCDLCDFKSTPHQLTIHRATHFKNVDQKQPESTEKKRKLPQASLKCKKCSFETDQLSEFVSHQCIHYQNQSNIQELEGSIEKKPKLSVESELTNTQIESTEADAPLKCSLCSFTCGSPGKVRYLNAHMKAHKMKQPIKSCDLCNFKSTPRQLLVHKAKHLRTQNNSTLPETGKKRKRSDESVEHNYSKLGETKNHHRCQHCSFTSLTSEQLKTHIKTHEQNLPIVKCVYCDFKSTPDQLLTHTALHFPNPSNTSQFVNQLDHESEQETIDNYPQQVVNVTDKEMIKNEYKCQYCSFNSDNQQAFNSHQLTHQRVEIFEECQYCNFKSSPERVKWHTEKNHSAEENDSITVKKEPKKKKCPHCNFKAGVGMLRRHISRHKKFKCDKCSFFTPVHSCLKLHNLAHQRNQPIKKCNFCPFESTNNALAQHMCLHINDAEYQKQDDLKQLEEDEIIEVVKLEEFEEAVLKNETIGLEGSSIVVNSPENRVEENSDIINFKCSLCPYSTILRIKLNLHKKKVHGISMNTELPSNETVLDNQIEQNSTAESSAKKSRFKKVYCKLCSAEVSETTLHIHMATHETHSNLKCFKCDFVSTYSQLTEHLRTIHRVGRGYLKLCSSIEPPKSKESSCKVTVNCQLCSAVVGANQLWRHMRVHENHQTLKCHYCDFTSTPAILQRHLRNIHESGKDCSVDGIKLSGNSEKSIEKVKCELCTALIAKTNLPYHMISHKTQTNLKCLKCDFVSTASQLSNHLRTKHNLGLGYLALCSVDGELDSISPFSEMAKCKLCYAEIFLTDLGAHMIGHNNRKLKCYKCNFVSSPSRLVQHMKLLHQGNSAYLKVCPIASKSNDILPPLQQNQNSSFDAGSSAPLPSGKLHYERVKCNLCSALVSITRLKLHIKAHQTHDTLKCFKCDFISTPRFVKDHMRSSHNVGAGYLKLCSKVICSDDNNKQLTSSSNVIPISSSENNFKCSLCSFSTSLRIKLKGHVKKAHSNLPKPATTLKCRMCSFSTPISRTLKKHTNTHWQFNKPIFQCQYCHVKGTHKQVVELHTKCTVPTDSRVLPVLKVLLNCLSCSFTCYFPAELKSHEESVHKNVKAAKSVGSIKKFQCENCSFSTFWQYVLERHVKSYHKEETVSVKEEPNDV